MVFKQETNNHTTQTDNDVRQSAAVCLWLASLNSAPPPPQKQDSTHLLNVQSTLADKLEVSRPPIREPSWYLVAWGPQHI